MGLFSCLSPEAFDVPRSDVPAGQTPSKTRVKSKKVKGHCNEDNICCSEARADEMPSQKTSSTEPITLLPSHAFSSTSLQTSKNASSRKSHISSLFSLSSSPSPSSLSSSRLSCPPRPVVVHLSMVGREDDWDNELKQPKRPPRPRLGRSSTAPAVAQTLDEEQIPYSTSLDHQSSSLKGRKRSLSTASISGPPSVRSRIQIRRSESNLSSDCSHLDPATAVSVSSSNNSSIVFQMDFDRPKPLVSSRPPSITSPTSAINAGPVNTTSHVQNEASRSRTTTATYPSYDYDHPEFDLSPFSTELTNTPDLVSFSSFDKSNSSFYPSPGSSPESSWISNAQPKLEQSSPERRLAALAALIVDVPTPRVSFETEDPDQSVFEFEQYPIRPLLIHTDSSEERVVPVEPNKDESWASSTTKTVAHKPRAMIKNVNGLKAEWRKNREAATWGEELTWEFIKAVNEGR